MSKYRSEKVRKKPYRCYDEKMIKELELRLLKEKTTFQDFVTKAIKDYLNGDYQPKKED